jgi:hypothetical protein
MSAYRQIEYPCVSIGGTRRDEYAIYEYGEYESWSVLAGQEKRSFIASFETLEFAREQYPEAATDGGKAFPPRMVGPAYIPVEPPEWFDPMDAGEHWDEDY